MIKNIFKIQIKYISYETSINTLEFSPSEELSKLLIEYQNLIKLKEDCAKPVTPDLLIDLRLENYIDTLPHYRKGGATKKLIDSLIQVSFQHLRFKELKVKGEISRLLGLYPELKEQYGTTLIEMSAADLLKAPVIEKSILKPNHNRIFLLINLFLDMIKQKPTKIK
jgi:hypothetical protein